MRKILIKLIKNYQKIPGNFHNYCKFTPTCSEYAITALERFGVIKGGFLSIKRILRCNPFTTYSYDPVPMKEGKKWKSY